MTTKPETLDDLFSIPGAGGQEPEAYAMGMRDFAENTPRPNPFDAETDGVKFAAYAQGWLDGKAIQPPTTTSHKPAINRKALNLLFIYTGHTFDIDRLAGDGMKEQRRQIMSALHGQKMPVSKSGINAIRRHFELMAGEAMDGATCLRDAELKFMAWAKAINL